MPILVALYDQYTAVAALMKGTSKNTVKFLLFLKTVFISLFSTSPSFPFLYFPFMLSVPCEFWTICIKVLDKLLNSFEKPYTVYYFDVCKYAPVKLFNVFGESQLKLLLKYRCFSKIWLFAPQGALWSTPRGLVVALRQGSEFGGKVFSSENQINSLIWTHTRIDVECQRTWNLVSATCGT